MKKVLSILFLATTFTLIYHSLLSERGAPNMRTLRIAIPSVNLSTDPHNMEDSLSMFLVNQLFNSLFRFNSEGAVTANLVERVVVSKDGLTYTFWLKKNILFSDGSEISSKDVIRSIQRPFNLGSAICADLSYIKGSDQAIKAKNGELIGVKELGQRVFSIDLMFPSDLLLTHLALPDLSVLKFSKDGNVQLQVFSGDYKIQSKNEKVIRLEKIGQNDQAAPELVVLKSMTREEAVKASLNGEIDTVEVYNIEANDLDKLKKNGWQKVIHSLAFENFLLLNPKTISRKQRIAMISAVNRRELIELLGSSSVDYAYGLIPANLPGSLGPTDVPINISEASKEEIEFEPVKISFNVGNYLHAVAADFLAKKWKSLGIQTEVVPLSQDSYYEMLFSKKGNVIIAGKGMDYPDGIANLSYFRTDVEMNFLFMENNSLDNVISELPKKNGADRFNSYRDIQIKILNHFTAFPLFFGGVTSGLWSGSIVEVPPHPFGFHYLKISEIKL